MRARGLSRSTAAVFAALVSAVMAGCGPATSDEQYVSICTEEWLISEPACREIVRASRVCPDGDRRSFLLVAQGSFAAGDFSLSEAIDNAEQMFCPPVGVGAEALPSTTQTPTTTLAEIASSAPADPDDAAAAADLTDASACPAEDGSSPRTITFAQPHPMCIDTTKSHVAVFDTSEGEIRVALTTAETPITVNNFVTLARWGYYDGTTIFRSDPSIDIIQGGAPRTESPSDPGPGYTIPDEPQFEETSAGIVGPYRYVPGQLVMARTALPNSSSAQYFFTTGENAARLDGQGVYVVFGETDEDGLGVLQSIIGLHEPGGALGGAPSRTVTVNSVTIEVS